MAVNEMHTAEIGSFPDLMFPHLYHPFETPMHPGVEWAEYELLAWLDSHGLLKEAKWANGIRNGKIAEYCARVYPGATDEGLSLAARTYAWIFCFDDGLCSLDGVANSPRDLGAIYLWMYEMIADPSGYDPVPFCKELCTALPGKLSRFLPVLQRATQDICRNTAAIATRSQYARWTAGLMTMLFANLCEAGRYASGAVPSLPEYMSERNYNGGNDVAFSLIDVSSGYEVTENIYNDEDVYRLRKIASLILCLCNDIFSYPKETKESSVNIVSVLMRERQLALQDALDEAASIHNQYMERYLAVEARLRKRADSPLLVRLLDQVRAYIRGNYDWHFGSPRYQAARYYDLSKALRPGEISALG